MGTVKAGRVTDLDVETSVGSGTYTAVGGVQDCKLDLQLNAIDVTDKDSAGYDEFEPGQTTATLNGTMNYEEDDAGQVKMLTMVLNKEKRNFRFRPWGVSSGADQWVWSGIVTQFGIDSPNKEALSTPFSIQLTGSPTQSDQ